MLAVEESRSIRKLVQGGCTICLRLLFLFVGIEMIMLYMQPSGLIFLRN